MSGPEEDRIIVGFEKNGVEILDLCNCKRWCFEWACTHCSFYELCRAKKLFHVSNSSGAEILTVKLI